MSILSRWSKAGIAIKAAFVVVVLGAPAAALAGRVVSPHQRPPTPVAVAPSPTPAASQARPAEGSIVATPTELPTPPTRVTPTPVLGRGNTALPPPPPNPRPSVGGSVAADDFRFACSAFHQPLGMEFADRSNCSFSAGSAFSGPVIVGCDGLPGGAFCMYAVTVSTPETEGLNPFSGQPQTIRPSPGARLSFTLGVVGAWPSGGTFHFEATATAGAQRHAVPISITLPTRPTGLGLSCRPQALTIALGGQGRAVCTLTSVSGYEGTFHLSCPPSGGIICADTSEINVAPGSSVTVPVVFSAPLGIRPTQYTLFVLPTPMQPGIYQDKVVYVTAQGQ